MAPRPDFAAAPAQDDRAERLWREVRGVRATAKQRAILLLRQTLVLAGIGSTTFMLGYGAGKLLDDPHAAALAHASGACIALEMAAAHGAIDEVERRMTLRALTSALNPHFERFPGQVSEISTECGKLTKGAMSGKIARGN
jgi:hypothetical protein